MRNIHNVSVGVWFVLLFIYLFHTSHPLLDLVNWLWIPLFFISLYYIIWSSKTKKYRTYKELVSKDNILNYLQAFILLRFEFIEFIAIIGFWLKFAIYLLLTIPIIIVIIKEIRNKSEISFPVLFGHTFLLYFVLMWFKAVVISQFGNEEIGSYWAKPYFKVECYVNVAEAVVTADIENHSIDVKWYYGLDSKKYIPDDHSINGIAVIGVKKQVKSDTYIYTDWVGSEYEGTNDSEVTLFYLESLSFTNKKLSFHKCEVNIGRNFCKDTTGTYWFVDLKQIKDKK